MQSDIPFIIEPEELQDHLRSELLIVDLCSPESYQKGHIPGAIHLNTANLISGIKPAVGKLPTYDQLISLCSSLGMNSSTHVVAYDDEGGPWAGRFLWTLDLLGHKHSSFLNGGLLAWQALGLPLEIDTHQRQPTDYEPGPDAWVTADDATRPGSPRAQLEDILATIEDPKQVVWDARSPAEYRGEKVLAEKAGHIPGAINFEWTQAMDMDNQRRIKPLTQIESELAALGITPDKQIITHCQTHRRSGFTYVVGKALGLDIRAYDGSWSEWGNHPDTPVEQGE